MLQTRDVSRPAEAIRRVSALTETTFLQAGKALESSIEILASQTSTFETVLAALESEALGSALADLSRTADQVSQLGRTQSTESVRLEQLGALTQLVAARIAQLKTSLGDVNCLAVNAKIAAANMNVPGSDFTSFAAEIGQTLAVARRTLENFAAELNNVRQLVAAAHSGQLTFEQRQRDAAGSITERLLATVKSVSHQHETGARASLKVKAGSARVRQRICDAVLALQIGDITRQRLEHADFALDLAAGKSGANALTGEAQAALIAVVHRLQAAQLTDAADKFERRVRQITDSLSSLGEEARGLRGLGDAVYGTTERGGGTFMMQLEAQVGEALALFEGFEAARADIAKVTATVSDATASLQDHLRKVQALEDDIRIMGLNTTFKCARIGREGVALSLIAQELRTYAIGFAKEAGALMKEVENVAGITATLSGGDVADRGSVMTGTAQLMRDSLVTLREMGQQLDGAASDLERDSQRVLTHLAASVTTLQAQDRIGVALREAADHLASLAPADHRDVGSLDPRVEQVLERISDGYSMADEREVHGRVLGRSALVAVTAPAAPAEAALEDFLF